MIIRVFPSRTAATPDDPLAFVGNPPSEIPQADEIHVSVAFSWDLQEAHRLAREWGRFGLPVRIGGPALGDRGEAFVPGRYLKPGYVVTSRGCPNKCWFCDVHRREGDIRELPIMDGHNVLDSNLLACSPAHVELVFQMLSRQPKRPVFTGGLEHKLITPEIALRLRQIKTDRLFLAYDTPDDLEPLRQAGKILQEAGFSRKHHLHAYVLVGFPKDTTDAAESRCREAWDAGFHPMAMRWRDPLGEDWGAFARKWARPAITRGYLEAA